MRTASRLSLMRSIQSTSTNIQEGDIVPLFLICHHNRLKVPLDKREDDDRCIIRNRSPVIPVIRSSRRRRWLQARQKYIKPIQTFALMHRMTTRCFTTFMYAPSVGSQELNDSDQ